jgi:Peptidase family M23
MLPLLRTASVTLSFLVLVPAAHAWTWPASGPVLQEFRLGTDPYSAGQHRGIDVGGAAGAPVLAPHAGTVSFAGSVPSNGLSLTIETPDGYSVTLVHLGSITVSRAVCRHDRADRDRRAIRPVSPPRDPDDDRSERLSRPAGIPPAATRPDADRHAVTRSGRPFHVRTDGHGARGACVAARERPGADDCVAAGSAHRRCDDRARLGRARRVRRAGHAVRRGRRAGRDRTPTQRRGRNRDQGSVDRRSPRPGSEVELTSPRNRGRTDRRPSRGPNDCADRDCAGAASHRDPRTRPGRCLPGSGRSGHPPLVCDSGLFGSASSAAGTDPHAEDRGSARRARDGAVVGRDGLRRRRGGSTCAGDPAPQASRCGRSGGPRGGTYHLWGCAST